MVKTVGKVTKVFLVAEDKKEIKKFITKDFFNAEKQDYEYYGYEVLFIRNEWDNDKTYQVTIIRKDNTPAIDKKDCDLFFDVADWDITIENKIITAIKKYLSEFKDIAIKFISNEFENI